MAGGNASLTIMFFVLDAAMNADLAGPPWRESGPVKALCPVPGYDRHFTVAGAVGMELVNVPITDDGPDMDAVEDLVANDPAVRCIWCVPKYSNPTGCIYSPGDRTASWRHYRARLNDRSWSSGTTPTQWHDFEFPSKPLTSILPLAKAAGTADSIAMFASTSKVTFSGSGIAFLGGSANFLDAMEERLSTFMIGPDKVNQLRHVRFLSTGLADHMRAHAELVRPKFDAVQRGLEQGLHGTGLAHLDQAVRRLFRVVGYPARPCQVRRLACCRTRGGTHAGRCDVPLRLGSAQPKHTTCADVRHASRSRSRCGRGHTVHQARRSAAQHQ